MNAKSKLKILQNNGAVRIQIMDQEFFDSTYRVEFSFPFSGEIIAAYQYSSDDAIHNVYVELYDLLWMKCIEK